MLVIIPTYAQISRVKLLFKLTLKQDLCLFIRGAGLMNLCKMNYLGLHNKPKAEVHPEHMRTGPKEEGGGEEGGGGGGGEGGGGEEGGEEEEEEERCNMSQ